MTAKEAFAKIITRAMPAKGMAFEWMDHGPDILVVAFWPEHGARLNDGHVIAVKTTAVESAWKVCSPDQFVWWAMGLFAPSVKAMRLQPKSKFVRSKSPRLSDNDRVKEIIAGRSSRAAAWRESHDLK